MGSPAISTSVLFNMLSDISIASRTNNDILVYNGSQWENRSQLTLAVSSATQSKLDLKADITSMNTALNLKANINSPTFTGTVSGITAAMVGLGNVANTAPSELNVLSASKLTTAINFTIGSTTRSFNGSTAVSWSLTEIGAQSYSSGLTTIAGLSGTGLLKLTSGTWGLDTTSYTRKAIITFTTNASGEFTTDSNIWGLDIILRLKKTTGVVVNNPGVSISTAAINFTLLDPTTDYNCLIIY